MKKWEQLKLDIDAATKAMETTEPKELYDIRHACVGNEAGSYDQEVGSDRFLQRHDPRLLHVYHVSYPEARL